jgi:hypothetical protein
MDVLATLQSNVNTWADAIEERSQRAAFLHVECDRLVGETIDLAEGKAKQASTKRAEHLSELELIEAQLSELHRRHEIAQQAVREYQLTQAQEAYTKADQEAREKRQALIAVQDEKRHFMNRGGRGGQSEESIRGLQALEVAEANAKAEVTIANRKAAEAGAALQALTE